MASLWDTLTRPVRHHYNYDQLATESDSLAENRYTDLGQQNAFRHAYVSALLALRHSLAESKLLGEPAKPGRRANITPETTKITGRTPIAICITMRWGVRSVHMPSKT